MEVYKLTKEKDVLFSAKGKFIQAQVPRTAKLTHSKVKRQLLYPQVNAISIDRKRHLDLAWQRQEARELIMANEIELGTVIEIQDLEHFEKVQEQAGSNVLILVLYSKTCGICKESLRQFDLLCKEAKQQKARVVFAKHNVLNEFDEYSDICRMYKLRAVPSFLFIDEGAVVRRLSMRDIRNLSGPSTVVRAAMADDLQRLKHVLRQVLFSRAPSAR